MAEFHAKNGRLMEPMMKRMDDLMEKQKQSHSHDDDCHSYINDCGGGRHREHAPNRVNNNRMVEIQPFENSDARGWLVWVDYFFPYLKNSSRGKIRVGRACSPW